MRIARLFAVLSFAAALPLVGLTAASPVQAAAPAATPAEIGTMVLGEVDRRAAVLLDQEYVALMEIYKDGTLTKSLQFDMIMKGLDKQFLTFTAPGDVAGLKVLMQDAETLYVYTPEFKKVRRVAAHMQNQGFLGSTFTYEHMTQNQLSRFYDAIFKGKEGDLATLELTPKADVKTSYSKLEVVIDSTKGGVTEIRYYDGSGNHKGTQTREDWVKIDGELLPMTVKMTDHNTGDYTVIRLSDVKVNQGLDDDQFSRRHLLRG